MEKCRGTEREEGEEKGGGMGGCSPETVKLETSDAQLGVRAGGCESSMETQRGRLWGGGWLG